MTEAAKTGAAAVVNATQSTVNAIKENVSASSSSFSQNIRAKTSLPIKQKRLKLLQKA